VTYWVKVQADGVKFARRRYFDTPRGVNASIGGSINDKLAVVSQGMQ
jgi:hypothetical protein